MPSTWPMDSVEETARPRLARHVRMRFDSARGQHVLLSPETVLMLNDTGASIVDLCDGTRTVAEIEAALRERYDTVVDGEVRRFVTELVSKHDLEVDHG